MVRVRRRPFDRLAAAFVVPFIGAGLHDRGVQIEIMRHHRGADDADGDVEHLGIGDDLGATAQSPSSTAATGGAARSDLDPEADRDHDQQRDDEGFEKAKALVHQQQQQEGVERGDQRAADQGNAEQQLRARSRCRSTSARSQAMMAASQASQSRKLTGRE